MAERESLYRNLIERFKKCPKQDHAIKTGGVWKAIRKSVWGLQLLPILTIKVLFNNGFITHKATQWKHTLPVYSLCSLMLQAVEINLNNGSTSHPTPKVMTSSNKDQFGSEDSDTPKGLVFSKMTTKMCNIALSVPVIMKDV